MVDKPRGNLDSQRIHSRNVARNPAVREARRDNKKVRKSLPTQQAPSVPKAPKVPTIPQKQNMENVDRRERMQSVVPQNQTPAAPLPQPSANRSVSIDSLSPRAQSLIKIMALKSLIDIEIGQT